MTAEIRWETAPPLLLETRVRLRFRTWGTDDWTSITVEGELSTAALSVLGSGLARYHVQVFVDGAWENLW